MDNDLKNKRIINLKNKYNLNNNININNEYNLFEEYFNNIYKNIDNNLKKHLTDKYFYETSKIIYKDYKIKNNNSYLLNSLNLFEDIFKYEKNKIDIFDYKNKYNYIIRLIKNSIENDDIEMIKKIIAFFNSEKKVAEQRKSEDEYIERLENKIKNIEKAKMVNLNDLTEYYSCLRRSILSYDEKAFDKEYTFYSDDMNESIHRGLPMNFSVPKKELPHLLGIRNPDYDSDDIILNLYWNYLKRNGLNHNIDNYLEYLYIYSEEDIKKLIIENKENKDQLKIINEYIIKSFNKCLTFLKIYEFKRIPEIILDYQISSDYQKTFKDDHTKDLVTMAGQFKDLSKNGKKISEIDYNKLNEQEKEKWQIIKSKFDKQSEIYIDYDSNKNKFNFNCIMVDDIIYNYKRNDYFKDLLPSIFIVSYNKKKYEKERKILKSYVTKALLLLCSKIKKDLNIKYSIENLNNSKLSIFNSKRERLINVETIKDIILMIQDKDIDKDVDNEFKSVIGECEDDYLSLKSYIEELFTKGPKNSINNMFEITEKTKEPPHIRMLQRIIDGMMRKKELYPQKDVAIIGFGAVRDIKNNGNFTDRFAKTLMGKTFLQLEFDLRKNGFSYKINAISEKINDKKIYYNYNLLIDDPNILRLYYDMLNYYKDRVNNRNIDK